MGAVMSILTEGITDSAPSLQNRIHITHRVGEQFNFLILLLLLVELAIWSSLNSIAHLELQLLTLGTL